MLLEKGKSKTSILALIGLLTAAPLHADPYQKLSTDILLVAKRSGMQRIAVLPFQPIGSNNKNSGIVLSERIISRLAGREGIEVVERTLLDRVLKEQRLGYDGVLDPTQAKQVGKVLGVQALMTGTFLPLSGNRLEVHTRLIDAETARILGVSIATVKKEWEDNSFLVSAPFDPFEKDTEALTPPLVRMTPDPFRDSLSADTGCLNWESRVDRMQAPLIEAKARYWATRLRSKGFSPKTLTRNPGGEIRSNAARHKFYDRVKQLYNAKYTDGIEAESTLQLEAADKVASDLKDKCY